MAIDTGLSCAQFLLADLEAEAQTPWALQGILLPWQKKKKKSEGVGGGVWGYSDIFRKGVV